MGALRNHQFTGLGFIENKSRMVFDPATLAMMFGASSGVTSTIATITSVAQPVLGVMGAISGIQEAKAQEAEFERQSKEERLMASIEAERMRREGRQKQSAERVAMLESGAMSGTAEGVLEQNAVAQELDALTVEFRGEQRARAAEFQAEQAGRGASPLNIFSAAVEGFSDFDPLNVGN